MRKQGTLQPLPLAGSARAGLRGVSRPARGDPRGRTSALADQPILSLPDLGRQRCIQRGETVLAQGSSNPGLFIVRQGLLREGAVSTDGRWLVHGLLGRGAVFGALTPHSVSRTMVRAVRYSRLTMIPASRFDELLQRRPDLAWSLLSRIEHRAARAEVLAQELAWCDVPLRVRRRLGELAREHGRSVPDGVRIEVPITQEDLAAMVGAARETVNRAVIGLISAGFVRVDRRRYVLQKSFAREEFDL